MRKVCGMRHFSQIWPIGQTKYQLFFLVDLLGRTDNFSTSCCTHKHTHSHLHPYTQWKNDSFLTLLLLLIATDLVIFDLLFLLFVSLTHSSALFLFWMCADGRWVLYLSRNKKGSVRGRIDRLLLAPEFILPVSSSSLYQQWYILKTNQAARHLIVRHQPKQPIVQHVLTNKTTLQRKRFPIITEKWRILWNIYFLSDLLNTDQK